MKGNDRHEEAQGPVTDQAEEFAARRRVLKGLAGTVPVALTLTNGAALANTSSHQCLTNSGTPPPNCSTDTTSLDGWSYAQVTGPDGSSKYCVAYAEEPVPGTLQITGYRYDYIDNNGDPQVTFIDQDGNTVNGGVPYGNPLTASCATSFA